MLITECGTCVPVYRQCPVMLLGSLIRYHDVDTCGQIVFHRPTQRD